MSETPKQRHGRCECGGVRFRITGPLRPVIVCHCGQCRRTHGHAAAYSRVARANLSFDADGTLAWYVSSETAERGFCRTCGASLFYAITGTPTVAVAAGALEVPTGLHVAGHIFSADKSDYYAIGDDHLPRFDGPWEGSPPPDIA